MLMSKTIVRLSNFVTIKECNPQQHGYQLALVLGHTFDVIINRDTRHIISDITVSDPGHVGKLTLDPFAVCFTTTLDKRDPMKKTFSFRKLHAIDVEAFKHSIVPSPMLQNT